MMMGIILLAAWTIGILIILSDRESASSRWAGLTALVGGCGFLAATLDDEIRPLMPISIDEEIHLASNIASLVCQLGLPYAFLLFSVHSHPQSKNQRWIGYLAILPLGYSLVTTQLLPELEIEYLTLAIWAIPYILLGSGLLLYLFLYEKDPLMKRSRFIILVIAVLPVLFVMVSIYILRVFGWMDAWRYNALVIFIQFLFFIGFSLKYGVMGFKLRVEQNRMNTTMRALTSGTSILNHTIKNEVGKMQLLIHHLESQAQAHPNMKEDIEDLYRSTRHMLDMVQRIQGKIQDIQLKESLHQAEELIDAAVSQVQPFLQMKQIQLMTEQMQPATLNVDPVHFHEVLVNVLRNAIEAIPNEGCIKIRTYQFRKYYTIMIEDNGKGIAKGNLPYVFEPFFSTKKHHAANFGLGLAYCYQVMREHQGFVEIKSEENVGTHVFLYFPRHRARGIETVKGAGQHGAYSCNDGRR